MKKSIAMLGMVLMLAGCAAAESEPLAAEPAALVEISPATEETAQTVEAAETTNPRPHPNAHSRTHARADSSAYGSTHASPR